MSGSAEPGRKAAYSPDIHWRVIWQRLGMGLSFRDIADNLNIATSTAFAAFKRFEETGEVSGTKQPPRDSLRKLNTRDKLFIVGLVLANPSMYLQEIRQEVEDVLRTQVSVPTICRVLARHGFTRKKIQQVAKQRSTNLRAAFAAQIMHCFHRNMLVWVDETGCDRRSHIRRCGYAFRGEAPVCHRSLHRGKRISSIVAMSIDGIVATESHKGSMNVGVCGLHSRQSHSQNEVVRREIPYIRCHHGQLLHSSHSPDHGVTAESRNCCNLPDPLFTRLQSHPASVRLC